MHVSCARKENIPKIPEYYARQSDDTGIAMRCNTWEPAGGTTFRMSHVAGAATGVGPQQFLEFGDRRSEHLHIPFIESCSRVKIDSTAPQRVAQSNWTLTKQERCNMLV